MAKPITHFGPMHGERTRRHQFVSDGVRGSTIVSIYEVDWPEVGRRLNVELMRQHAILSADLTVEEATWLRDACAEYIDAHGDGVRHPAPVEAWEDDDLGPMGF